MMLMKFESVLTTRMSSPSGCQQIPVGPRSTRVSATIWWNVALVGSMSMKLTVPLEKFETARRVMFGAIAMLTGSVRRIVSSTVKRLLLTTKTWRLSRSST